MRSASTILCLNAGSSSLKFALFRHSEDQLERLRRGVVSLTRSGGGAGVQEGVARVLDELSPELTEGLAAVGHRVVHGGSRFTKPVRIDDSVLGYLRETIRLAPAHQPGSIAGIEAVRRIDPALPQVACFDTAFHNGMPCLAQRFALPAKFWERGVRRYGFHGLSYEYVREVLGENPPARIIIAHLGNGSSMAALKNGHPVETTMGFTPNSGLVMGSRCGDLEPGVVLHLLREEGFTVDTLDALLNRDSGLRGLSGLSSDMRELLEKAPNEAGARRAIEQFCYSARKHIGALSAVLGGLDLLVFTGGVGENAASIREQITQPLGEFLGFDVRVIPTDEERVVARHTAALCL